MNVWSKLSKAIEIIAYTAIHWNITEILQYFSENIVLLKYILCNINIFQIPLGSCLNVSYHDLTISILFIVSCGKLSLSDTKLEDCVVKAITEMMN